MRNKLPVLLTILGTLAATGTTTLWAQDSVNPPTSKGSGILGRVARRSASADQNRLSEAAAPSPLPSLGVVAFTFGTMDFPGAANSGAGAINNMGQVIGSYGPDFQPYAPGIHGFRLSGTAFKTLDYPGAVTTYPNGINKNGAVVGSYTLEQSGLPYHGFQLVNNVYTTLDYPGADDTSPLGINDSGQVAGSWFAGSGGHGFLYSNGAFTSLDPAGSIYTQGVGINNAGDIVGVYTDTANHDHGFLLHQGVYTLVDYPGATDTWLLAINDKGQMVGMYGTGALVQGYDVYHGFLDNHGTFSSFDVPFAGVAVTGPYGINNKSQITGGYSDTNGNGFGFIASFK
jgi:uncharacterized membrane protein